VAHAVIAVPAISNSANHPPPDRRVIMRQLRYTTGEMRLKAFTTLGLAGLALAIFAAPAWSHHSFAMFDMKKQVTLNGTVKEFQWISPHAWIVMTTPVPGGEPKQWAIELPSTRTLARQGFTPKTLRPGMKIAIDMHPLKDGSPGGTVTGLSLTLPDGKVMRPE
jgi:Family of unknown function (DUF6152)